jgi:predicted naringenin-chalcone synthase
MSSCISAIGIANPPNRISQTAINGFMERAFRLNENDAIRLKKIYDNSAINSRYSVIPDFGSEDFADNQFFPANELFRIHKSGCNFIANMQSKLLYKLQKIVWLGLMLLLPAKFRIS